jgi:SIR2-like domain
VQSASAAIETLAAGISDRRVILFGGAGLSISVGLPSWRELIERMCADLGADASQIAGPDSYRTLAEYYRIKRGEVGSLRRWMDQSRNTSRERIPESRIHALIVQLGFPIIYTTNYDRNIEAAFEAHGRPYVKIANARDLAKVREDVTQIVKFHGDFDDEESLVITETDYFNRLRFDSPLDIKFRADALGKTVLFLGHSMSDMNIRLLLHWLWRTWKESGYERDRPQSFIFMTHENEMQDAVLAQWGVTAVRGDRDDPEEALTRFLEQLACAARL